MVGDEIVRMGVQRDGDGVYAGMVAPARLLHKVDQHRGIVKIANEEAVLQPLPPRLTVGATVQVEIERSAWQEPGRRRLAKARIAAPKSDKDKKQVPVLGKSCPTHVQKLWDELFDAARLGEVGFKGGQLLFHLTPAFLTVDIDGTGSDLPISALRVLAKYLGLWGVGGMVVTDVPDCPKSVRLEAVRAFDGAMRDNKYERTAINGFGVLQVVLPRREPSVLERARLDTAGSDAISLMKQAVETNIPGALNLVAAPDVVEWIASRPHLLPEMRKLRGADVHLRADRFARRGYVERASPSSPA